MQKLSALDNLKGFVPSIISDEIIRMTVRGSSILRLSKFEICPKLVDLNKNIDIRLICEKSDEWQISVESKCEYYILSIKRL